MSRSLTVIVIVTLLAACETPPAPTLACSADSDCNTGEICKKGICAGDREFICLAAAECIEALQTDKWNPADLKDDVNSLPVCMNVACVEDFCKLEPKPAQTTCEDDDGLPCTQGLCDGEGLCQVAAQVSPDTCLIGPVGQEGCVSKEVANPDNDCEMCNPGLDPRGWTAKSPGASCDDGDGLACTIGACDGAGGCDVCTGDDCVRGARIASQSCLIEGVCRSQGAKLAASDGCQVCDPQSSQVAWTSLSDGAVCERDGEPCRPGTCAMGACEFEAILPGYCHLPGAKGGACVQDGGIRVSTGCDFCDAGSTPTQWSPLPSGASCTDDDAVACTEGVCDGKSVCVATANDDLCKPNGPCTGAVCDASKGCLTPHLPKEATCSGSDGIACTVEHCDGKGVCDNEPTPDPTQCDDSLDCTLDSCDVKTGCEHVADSTKCDDGNVCTSDSCDVKQGCVQTNNTLSCDGDGLSCTSQQCVSGVCQLTVQAGQCAIAGGCYSDGAKDSAGCKRCEATKSPTSWSTLSQGASCQTDGLSCTLDQCDGAGSCLHSVQDSACDDGLGCTRDACAPKSAFASKSSGCEHVDRCPWGHVCDKATKACLTPKPVVLVSASTSDPMPTNPVALRHVLDAKTGQSRTWVIYQSQPCATANGSSWSISQSSVLRALVLDGVEESSPGAGKPKPAVVTFAKSVQNSGLCQGFAAVSADPSSSSQGWVTWLEADINQAASACLDSSGRGGVVRMARLDGAKVTDKATWPAAGKTCPLDNKSKPLMVTPGFEVLPGAQTDPAKRAALWMRPKADSLTSPGDSQQFLSGTANGSWGKANPLSSDFSTVHPLIVALPKADAAGHTHVGLALEEEVSGSVIKRKLWAQGFGAGGVKAQSSAWLDSAVAGVGQSALAGVSAVCGLDAAVNSADGSVAVAMVVRQAGKDRVWLVIRDSKGGLKGVKVVDKNSKGDCRKGVSASRLVRANQTWYVAITVSSGSNPQNADFQIWSTDTTASKLVTTLDDIEAQTSDSAAGNSAPVNALHYRGIANLLPGPQGTLTTIVEAYDTSAKKGIALFTFKP